MQQLENLLPGARWQVISPGRVNLLGEHVDYNDGAVLPAAIDRAVRMQARPSADGWVHLRALDLGEEVVFGLQDLERRLDAQGKPLPAWARYPAGVAWALQQHGLAVVPCEAAFTSDVPMGAGLSSSAAVEVGFAALWQQLGGWSATRLRLAQLAQQAENQYVGVNCGLMDQFASANGVEGHALYFDTRSLEFRAVPLPADAAIVIADSRVRRDLAASSAYNDLRAACEQAVAVLRPHLPGMRALRDVSLADFERLEGLLPPLVAKRARHVVAECARVEQAIRLLDAGDANGFGALMFATHASLRDLYQVSIRELDLLVELAAGLPGCWGARLSGAGFGGCTVNLVRRGQAEEFIARLAEGYRAQSGRQAEIYLCRASAGVKVAEI